MHKRGRNRGDYNIDPNLSDADAERLISIAQTFLSFVVNNIDSI